MACGENIRRVYHQTRLDLSWNFRSSLEEARRIKVSQDEYCERALSAHTHGKVLDEKFPFNLEWEALVDVLRGKVICVLVERSRGTADGLLKSRSRSTRIATRYQPLDWTLSYLACP